MRVHNPDKLPTMPIADILPSQGELKDLTDKNYAKLKNNIEKRGFLVPVYTWVNKEGLRYLLDGHQRQRVLTTEGWNEPIPYLTITADTMQEAMAILLEVTSQYGTITQEGLDKFIAEYELPEMEVYEATQFDAIFGYGEEAEEEDLEDSPYTGKIEPPVYDIKGEKPNLEDLYTPDRTKELIAEIDEANIPKDIKEFLKVSAYRHTIFNYANIAEYYAQSPKEVQELMEKSALVIIDYEKAVELGFVKLSEEVAQAYVSDKEQE